MSNEIKKAIDDVGDAVKEGLHRGSADAEREKRAEFGDVMTPGEHVESAVNEVSERTKAGVDHAKRAVRDNT